MLDRLARYWIQGLAKQDNILTKFSADSISNTGIAVHNTVIQPLSGILERLGKAMWFTNSTKFDMILDHLEILQEREEIMALNLDILAAEVDRATAAHMEAADKLSKLVDEVKWISNALAFKTVAAENSVDKTELDSLIERLRKSTDHLQATVSTTQEQV